MTKRVPKPKGETKDPASGGFRPTRDDILRFVADNSDRAGKRDIAKAFSLKGTDRTWLKDMLRDLQDDGLLQKRGKRLARPGQLPPVAVLDIYGRDDDGTLLARSTDEGGTSHIVALRGSLRGAVAGIGDRVLAKVFRSDEPDAHAYTARIMKVLDRRREAVLGVLRATRDGGFRIEPVERRQAELVVAEADIGDAVPGDLVEVEPERASRYGLARARVIAVLGSLTSEKAVSMIALHQHDIPHVFPPDVLAEAANAVPVAAAGREDWRDLGLITIDPADAKDHDDAVHALPDPDPANSGGTIVTVAIADVAAYVLPGSAMDREALRRGNSVYFPDRVVPMLPERISNDLCSLREGEDRPALAVRMTFGADGRKIRHAFHRVTMRSHAKLSYQQAQAAIDGATDEKTAPLLDTILKPLWAAYTALKRGREARQPLELDLPERKIVLKPDGTVDRVVVPERLDSHRLIEEFMIQANVAAAETLEAKRQALIYRIHDAPSLAKQESLREFLQTIGLSLARGPQLKPDQFNSILGRVRGEDNEALVNEVVLRSQSQAEYSPENIGHFGLSLRRYAHFTSPIRRYADLVVHRALIAALGLGPGGITGPQEERLRETAEMISASERRAMAAERDTIDRLVAAHLAERAGDTFEGRISGVTKSGLFVQLPAFGADGLVPISQLGDDYYHFDEGARSLFGERSGKGYQLADIVDVRLVEVAPLAGGLRFEMISPPKPLRGSRKSFHKAGRQRARAHQHRGGRRK